MEHEFDSEFMQAAANLYIERELYRASEPGPPQPIENGARP